MFGESGAESTASNRASERITRRSILGASATGSGTGLGSLAGDWPVGATATATSTSSSSATYVRDTAGNEYGELTGTNDAAEVQSAIDGRPGTEGIVVPDPGFALDWEQAVELPDAEYGFTLVGEGMPEAKINTDYEGTSMLYKPAASKAGPHRMGYRVGGFVVVDRDYEPDDTWIGNGTNDILEAGIVLDDVKESVVHPTVFLGCPGVIIKSTNGWSNQNLIQKPQVLGPNGPAVTLENTIDDNRADQNWVFAPHYSDDTDQGSSDVVAYLDEGNDNNWLYTRVEHCRVAHRMVDCNTYTIREGDWDRTHSYEFSVREEGTSEGRIELRSSNRYKKLRLIGNNTAVSCIGESSGESSTNPEPTPADLFRGLRRMTTATSLSAMGLRDASNDGTVHVHGTQYNHPFLRLTTGEDQGHDTAVLDLGERSLKDQSFPKIAYRLNPVSESDWKNVRIQHGFYTDDDHRAEFVYHHAGDDSETWSFVVKNGDTYSSGNWKDLGVGAESDQDFALNRELSRNGDERWSAIVDKTNEAVHTGTGRLGRGTWRISIKTLQQGEDKTWDLTDTGGMRFYRF